MKGHIRERSPFRCAIILAHRNKKTNKRKCIYRFGNALLAYLEGKSNDQHYPAWKG